jgi:predicted nucleic acid-binding protein
MDPMMVLDTDVFIDHFRGQEAATAYIHSVPVEQRATTDIPVMELYKGAANQQELATILRFLTHNRVTRLPVSTTASQWAVKLVHQYGLAYGLGIPDAPIAAIEIEGAHTLVTDNVRRFRFIPGLQVLRAPYRPSPPSSPT